MPVWAVYSRCNGRNAPHPYSIYPLPEKREGRRFQAKKIKAPAKHQNDARQGLLFVLLSGLSFLFMVGLDVNMSRLDRFMDQEKGLC